MISWLDRYQLKLWKLKKGLRKANDMDNKFRKTERYKTMTADEKKNYEDEIWQTEFSFIYADIGELETKIFLRKIDKYNIPVPSKYDLKLRDEYWDGNVYGKYRELSKAGFYKLTKLLREERKSIKEEWIPIITAVSGLLAIVLSIISTVSLLIK